MTPTRSGGQYLSGFIGFLMLAMSVPCITAAIYDVVTQSADLSGSLIVGSFMAFVALAGLVLVGFAARKPRPGLTVTESFERRALALAHDNAGTLTVAQLALHTHLSVDQADATLEHLAKRGVAQARLTDGGDLIYSFPGFSPVDISSDAFATFDAELASSERVTFQEEEVELETHAGADGSVSENANAYYYTKKNS